MGTYPVLLEARRGEVRDDQFQTHSRTRAHKKVPSSHLQKRRGVERNDNDKHSSCATRPTRVNRHCSTAAFLATLFFYLFAELRSMCQRQRDSGKSMRGALVRKQGELDEASAEASWLRAEHGFIVGDM